MFLYFFMKDQAESPRMAVKIDRLSLCSCQAEGHIPQGPSCDLYMVVSCGKSIDGEAVLRCVYDDSANDI